MPRLTDDELAELRHSIRVVRRLVERRRTFVKGMEAANAQGQPVDPLDDSASGFCVNGAFIHVSRPSRPLFVAWLQLCHKAAGDLLGEPDADLFHYNDNPAIGPAELIALLDEVEARLDLLERAPKQK